VNIPKRFKEWKLWAHYAIITLAVFWGVQWIAKYLAFMSGFAQVTATFIILVVVDQITEKLFKL